MDISGRTVLVTGAAHRVGKSIALGLANAGANVVIHFWKAELEAQKTLAEIQELGREALRVKADLRELRGVKSLFSLVDMQFDSVDVVVNSAAVMDQVDFLEANEEDWHHTFDLNIKGVFFVTQFAAKRMLEREGGVIINISDTAAHRPWRRYPIHSVSKAGVEMLTRTAAICFAPTIRVNAITPGPVLKPDQMEPQRWSEITQQLPLRRSGSPEDILRAVQFLIENDFITGESLVVDGGDLL
jgi:NAD(P)-dependent dehydrogenase (short-subunit alcohol dehydrogenase family)